MVSFSIDPGVGYEPKTFGTVSTGPSIPHRVLYALLLVRSTVPSAYVCAFDLLFIKEIYIH